MIERIFLIGYRGTGKSTIGRLLAARLGWDFADADTELESRYHTTIRAIFEAEGEPGFRDKEAIILGELAQRTRCVIATGGGVILRPENRQRLRGGHVVWLTASPTTIEARIAADPLTGERRPNLTSAGGLPEIERLLAIREPLYRECADVIVDADGPSPVSIVAHILTTFERE